MSKLRIAFICLLLICVNIASKSQECKLSKDSYISLLTCSSGSELYSVFGHSALRVKDDSLGIDLVFNYGTFDFNTPNFYLKFMNGDLDYMLAYTTFGRFKMVYEYENRAVEEGVLKLNQAEKQHLWDFLCWNIKEENRYYRYDFFFDNCATRLRDIVFKTKNVDHLLFNNTSGMTFRDYLHSYIDEESWTAQGIDLLLGQKTDVPATENERAFLPEYLSKLFSTTDLYVSKQNIVNKYNPDVENKFTILPVHVTAIVLLLSIMFTIIEVRSNRTYVYFDILLFSICALLSLLFWYLWLFTKHDVCSLNANVLWASILYWPLIFLFLSQNKISKFTSNCICILNIVALIAFILLSALGVQDTPSMTIPFAIALLIRNVTRLYKIRVNTI